MNTEKILAIGVFFITILMIITAIWFICSVYETGYQEGLIVGQRRLNDTNLDYWFSITDEGTENFRIMRDLFTPAYNDSVTVENVGYKSTVYDWDNNSIISDGGWMFWVNHSRVLDSLYFDDKMCYKVLFPTSGFIEVLQR